MRKKTTETGDDPREQETATRSRSARPADRELVVPGLSLLCHPEVSRIGERCVLAELSSGREVLLSRTEPSFSTGRALDDAHLSRKPLRLVPLANRGVRIERGASPTEVRIEGEPLDADRDVSADELERGVVLMLSERVVLLLHRLDPSPPRGVPPHGLVGESRAMVDVRRDISQVAEVEVSVLVRGATGTGKELVAQALHRASARRGGPFVAVNLGAVPPTLAAAELFGAAKGAYTGADRPRRGCFERARGGTLFLDEIGEAPAAVQVHLLRALETGRFLPVGGEAEVAFDARILAATDADLEAAVTAERFREPLLHRLGGFEIHLPSLIDRRDDLGRLLVHFLGLELEALGEGGRLRGEGFVSAPLVERLARCAWSGNVRQLRNVVRQLVITHRGATRLRLVPRIEKLLGPGLLSAMSPRTEPTIRTGPTTRPVGSLPSPGPPGATSSSKSGKPGETGSEGPRLQTLCVAEKVDGATERTLRRLLGDYRGYEVGRAETLLLLFARPLDAVGWALAYHQALARVTKGPDTESEAGTGRSAIHLAEVVVRRNPSNAVARGARVLELVEDTAAERARGTAWRLFGLALPRQTLLSRNAFDLARQASSGGEIAGDDAVRWLDHGPYIFDPTEPAISVYEVGRVGTAPLMPPPQKISAEPSPTDPLSDDTPTARSYRPPSEVGEDELIDTLRTHRFNLRPTAAALGISRASLYNLIEKRPDIRKARDLDAAEVEAAWQRLAGDLDTMAAYLEVSRTGLRRRMTELGFD